MVYQIITFCVTIRHMAPMMMTVPKRRREMRKRCAGVIPRK
jgi:hypothetical protein